MNTDQILKVLKNERECIKRQGTDKCNRTDHPITGCKFCDLCLPADEILEVYDFLINEYELLQNEGADSYSIRCDVSKEEVEELIGKLRAEPMRAVRYDPAEIEFKSLPDNFRVIKGDND